MAERVSALEGYRPPGRFGLDGETGVILGEVPGLVLHQVAAWADTLSAVGQAAAKAAGVPAAPGPGLAVSAGSVAMLRIEPLKWWMFGAEPPAFSADEGVTLDLSHSRTHVRVRGPEAATLLNRHLPLDLRDSRFPVGSVASSAFHHVGITLWRSESGYELFLPRGFALSLWEMLLESAAQFGGEVV